MKLFWGKPCPEKAEFSCETFSGTQFFRGIPERIETLPEPKRFKGKKKFFPEKTEWDRRVNHVLAMIRRGEVEKVVLSRACVIELEEAPDPFQITAALQEKTTHETLFCLVQKGKAFLGATPERLFSRSGDKIESEALAGTKWKSETFCEKETKELEPVERFLQQTLTPFCLTPPIFSPLQIYQTNQLQHLHSTCHATLFPHISDSQLHAALHPTPALAGSPRPQALALIEKWEQRGLYGGFLGWRYRDHSEYVVLIRSCLLEGNWATLHTGVGIVAGSHPDAEWEELDQKLQLYDKILL